jgi:hypothetical protein
MPEGLARWLVDVLVDIGLTKILLVMIAFLLYLGLQQLRELVRLAKIRNRKL